MQLVVFSVGNEEYGIDVECVGEIIRYTKPTMLPKSHQSVLGIINLRDRVIPIVSFRRLFGKPEIEISNSTRIIIVELLGRKIGFVVDAVTEVMEISEGLIEEYTDQIGGVDEVFVTGIAKLDNRLVIILNLEKVVSLAKPINPEQL